MQHTRHHHSLILLAVIMLFFALGAFHEVYSANDFSADEYLLSVKANILNEDRRLAPGSDLTVVIKMFNRQAGGRADVILTHSILNHDGEIIISEVETAAIETQTSIVRRFTMPQTIPPGQYKINVELSSLDKKYKVLAWQSFELIEVSKDIQDFFLYLIGIITLLNTIVILFRARKATKEQKISEKDLEKIGLLGSNLKSINKGGEK